ncbi:nectin-4-like isoform X2 [Pyxicephalus adspersus]|uniref:nectin-4-like isoform X2 n=1 Tax=Pyxicephalus adspersus TaxID=30357 RepID=UPI003B5C0329
MCLLAALFLSLLALVASGSQVKCGNSSLAVLGEDVTLTCEFQGDRDVPQVSWQKKKGKVIEDMATYSKKYGTNISKPFEGHVSITNPSSRSSSIKISKLEKDDEACYVCLFHTFPNGIITGEVCLTDLHPPPDSPKPEVGVKDHNKSNSDKGDPEMEEGKQRQSWVWIIIIIIAPPMLIVLLRYYVLNKRKRPTMKQSEVENGLPMLTISTDDESEVKTNKRPFSKTARIRKTPTVKRKTN